MKRAILLANMGAPISEPDMKVFLKRMFNDKAIIYAPTLVRSVLSTVISNVRYKSSWQKYEQIGGSPLQRSMKKMAADLQLLVGDTALVSAVYSYSEPFIEHKICELYHAGIKDITILSMYPQASYSTTGSVQTSLDVMKAKFADIQFQFIEDYFDNEQFIQYWVRLIQQKIDTEKYQNPTILFSSHAIPQSFIKRGDSYAEKMQVSAQLIASKLNLPYTLGYQSKIGPIEWTRPYTVDALKALSEKGVDEIIVVPLSFVNENLETRFDIDTELIPYGLNDLKLKSICRVFLPDSDEILTTMFYSFLK